MPIYVYECTSCKREHEALQKLVDAPLTDCPSCGQATLSKQLTAAGFQLKGNGWYATDFKGSKPAATSSPSSEKSDSPSAKPEPAASCASSCACHP